MTGMGKRIVAIALAGLGLLALGSSIASWGACWSTPGSEACLAASDANAGMQMAAGVWLVAVLVCGLGLFSAKARRGAAISAALLVIVNPLTDPGFIWAFDSADSTPGRGVIGALAIICAAVIVSLPHRSRAATTTRTTVVETA